MHSFLPATTLAQSLGGTSIWLIILLIIVGLIALFIIAFVWQFIHLYVQALLSNARVGIFELIGMRLRKVDIRQIVQGRIRAVKAGIEVPTNKLETHYLAGGRVNNVVSAMIAARGAKIPLEWDTAAAIDLAGRDILDAVQTSVNPKVIDCPAAGGPRQTIDAVAKDGIQLVGGATEETVIARVGQGIVSTIGSAHDHKAVLENPDEITKTVMNQGLDAGTAFEILSIDIADIDVGENIGAKLQTDQAVADKNRAQAAAESRRAMAMAVEQEMKARIQENRAAVVLAEADVPKAMAEAFRKGNLGIMDYYRMKNMVADTQMRGAIAGVDQQSQGGAPS
jgi:uncharacterized protein YqfA (UPF0365 family)